MDLVKSEYKGHKISFDDGAWFNATEAAKYYGKRPVDWLKQKETQDYLSRLCEFHKVIQNHFIKTRKGKNVGGTWLHPRLAVPFARWCDIDFAIWCDDQIDRILRGTHPHFNWKKIRHEATSSFKVMNEALRIVREAQGKVSSTHHFANEARLVNWALAGSFKGLDRESLSYDDLTILAKLEVKNSVLIGHGLTYNLRKGALAAYAAELRTSSHLIPFEAAA